MDITFSQAIEQLNKEAQSGDAAFEVIKDARPPQDYFLQSILPERNIPSYKVENGDMVIRSTMAGSVGMDSEYPEGGVITASSFLKGTEKIGNAVTLPEKALRNLQATLNSGGSIDMAQEALNFLDKMILQPHFDTFEYMRGQIFTTGKINWTFNKKTIDVDYGVPAGNILANNTGTASYDQSASKFWDDMVEIQALLGYDVAKYIMHQATFSAIIGNSVNDITVTEKRSVPYGAEYDISRLVGNDKTVTNDAREQLTIRTYNMEGELIDESDPSNTIKKPFFTAGKVTAIGNDQARGYRPGQGSADDSAFENALGYTHIGPTVEGGGQAGRWGRIYTPEAKPMQLRGEGVTNGLPVLDAPDKIAIASTDLS